MNSVIVVGLQEISKIFQLIYYRNKNQHRHASWWKCFSLLKRNIDKLIQELLVVNGDGDGGRRREEEETIDRPTATPRSHSRIGFMRNILLPKCYLPFTQLIRDSQFSAIGLILLAELAKIRRMLEKINAGYDNNNNNNDKNSSSAAVGGVMIKGSAIDNNNHHSTRKSFGMEHSSLEEEPDVGERIPRELPSKVKASHEGGAVIGSLRSKKTRKKVHVNEIDQLFDGLA